MNIFEPTHLIILLVIVLLLFGGKKIPELMRGVGQGVGELQKGLNDAKSKMSVNMDQDPAVQAKSEATALEASTPIAAPATGEPTQTIKA